MSLTVNSIFGLTVQQLVYCSVFSQSPCLVMGPWIKKLWAELTVENHACKVDLEHNFGLPCVRVFPEE